MYRITRRSGVAAAGPIPSRDGFPGPGYVPDNGPLSGTYQGDFDLLSGFDETLNGHEDVDFAWRAQLAGVPLLHADAAIMHYRLRHEPLALARQRFSYGLACTQLYAKFPRLGLPRTRLRLVAATWGRHALGPAPFAWTGRERQGS